jgi:virginiamycin A acetyltransferase
MLNNIKSKIYWLREDRRWRQRNRHNYTTVSHKSTYKKSDIQIGNGTYGEILVLNDCEDVTLNIGCYCCIGPDVTFLLGRDHASSRTSLYPFKQMLNLETPNYRDAISKGSIVVDDDVWIGYHATILSGVHIGQGAVIAAGAVVTKNVPPYAIVGGVPAKVISYRFSQELIEQLSKLDYSKLSVDIIRDNLDDLYTSLDGKSPKEVAKIIEWFPKK